jgi:hypothetical protein
MKQEDKIAQLLRVAEWRLTYCEKISMYPHTAKKRNFDPASPIDSFYKNVCVMAFSDVVLIITSLLDEKKKAISFWNWSEFAKKRETALRSLKGLPEFKVLKKLRNQVVAHQDNRHQANTFPDARIKGYIHPQHIANAQKILLDLIVLFHLHTKEAGTPYAPNYFDNSEANMQIMTMLEAVKPKLTDDYVI